MSLTLVCLYIIIGLCFLLFINYKFLKIFITPNRKYASDANSNTTAVMNKNKINNNNDNNHQHHHHQQHHHQQQHQQQPQQKQALTTVNDIWSIPGPLSIPFFGTKWIYLWKYKLSKIHEVYKGTIV